MSNPLNPERVNSFDFMRAIAILCVVVIHSAFGYESSPGEEFLANWVGTFARPCIAIFLFVAGYFFSGNMSRVQFLYRIRRVLVPYSVFSVLALLYQNRIVYALQMIVQHPWEVVGNFLIGNTWGVYWFIPVILTNYILGWLLVRPYRPSLVWITIFFLVVNLIHVAYLDRFVTKLGLSDHPILWLYRYRFYLSWPFYFFFGMLARKYQLPYVFRANSRKIIALWLLVFGVYNVILVLGVVEFGGYNSIIDTLSSVSAVALLCVFDVDIPIMNYIGKSSYTIYLIHYFFVSLANRAIRLLFENPPFLSSILIFAFALGGSLAFCWITRKMFGYRAHEWFGV